MSFKLDVNLSFVVPSFKKILDPATIADKIVLLCQEMRAMRDAYIHICHLLV